MTQIWIKKRFSDCTFNIAVLSRLCRSTRTLWKSYLLVLKPQWFILDRVLSSILTILAEDLQNPNICIPNIQTTKQSDIVKTYWVWDIHVTLCFKRSESLRLVERKFKMKHWSQRQIALLRAQINTKVNVLIKNFIVLLLRFS